MQVGVIGLSHRSGSLALREKLSYIFQLEFSSFSSCIENSVLLSTCNRIELYFSSTQLSATHISILHILSRHGLSNFFYAFYSYFGRDCFVHLSRVITGMDSAIFGENAIKNQVKLAYEKRRRQCALSPDLHYLFQKGLKIGKELRRSFTILQRGDLSAGIESIIHCLKRDVKTHSILFIGYSMLNRTIIRLFQSKGYANITLCTRVEKGCFPSVKRMGWEKLPLWDQYDIVICATYHNSFVLPQKMIRPSSKKEVIIFDLGVPRNVDPKLGKHDCIYLYSLTELEKILSAKQSQSGYENTLCNRALEEMVVKQMTLFDKRRAAREKYGITQPKNSLLVTT